MIARREPALVASLFFTALLSCRGAVHEPQVVRLVDLFPSAVVSGSVSAPSEIPPTEWRCPLGPWARMWYHTRTMYRKPRR